MLSWQKKHKILKNGSMCRSKMHLQTMYFVYNGTVLEILFCHSSVSAHLQIKRFYNIWHLTFYM